MTVATPEPARARRSERGRPRRAPLRLEWRTDGQLVARTAARTCPVRAICGFPWSAPGRFVSLRDDGENEVAWVRDPGDLEAGSRAALERALVEAGFVLVVERVESVEEEVEIRCFRVRTRQGRRSFQTARTEWPRGVPGGGLLFRDVSEDLYYVPDPERLDARSRALLHPYVG